MKVSLRVPRSVNIEKFYHKQSGHFREICAKPKALKDERIRVKFTVNNAPTTQIDSDEEGGGPSDRNGGGEGSARSSIAASTIGSDVEAGSETPDRDSYGLWKNAHAF